MAHIAKRPGLCASLFSGVLILRTKWPPGASCDLEQFLDMVLL
jgi:hypothetical protein